MFHTLACMGCVSAMFLKGDDRWCRARVLGYPIVLRADEKGGPGEARRLALEDGGAGVLVAGGHGVVEVELDAGVGAVGTSRVSFGGLGR